MILYWTIVYISRPFLRLFWLQKILGKKRISKKGPVILAANHLSFLDFALIMAASPRQIHFLAAEWIYDHPFFRWVMNKNGNIKVPREGSRRKVYEEAAKVLNQGKVLGLFPEGSRSKDGFTQKAYLGVAKMALSAKCDIIPVAIHNTHKVWGKQHKKPQFKRICKVKFLAPIKYADIKGETPERIVHDLLMPAICKELGHEYPI